MHAAPHRFARFLNALAHDREGATLIEYALILGLISMAALSAISYFGDSLRGPLQKSADAIEQAQP